MQDTYNVVAGSLWNTARLSGISTRLRNRLWPRRGPSGLGVLIVVGLVRISVLQGRDRVL